MIDYTLLENAIVTRLSAFSADGFDVVNVPQSESEFVRPITRARISVGYSASSWGDVPGSVRSTSAISQCERLEFVIMISSRTIRGERSIHETIKRVRNSLIGFAPPDCDRIYLIKGAYEADAYSEGTWMYTLVVGCTTLAVQYEQDEYGELSLDDLPPNPDENIRITQINIHQNL